MSTEPRLSITVTSPLVERTLTLSSAGVTTTISMWWKYFSGFGVSVRIDSVSPPPSRGSSEAVQPASSSASFDSIQRPRPCVATRRTST